MGAAVVRRVGGSTLELVQGDITDLEVDAIVNPSNSQLRLGGGVAGAIRRKGGPSIQQECDRIGACPVGGAVVTGGGELPARWVIHAVGPVWGRQNPEESDELLASACREALARSADKGVASVALPSISTGIFGFPLERAAPILLREAVASQRKHPSARRVIFCLFDEASFGAYLEALEDLVPP